MIQSLRKHPKVQRILGCSMRMLLGVSGPIGASAANFLLSFILLGHVPAAQFGLFAFVQTIIAFGFGISNALFSSPLMAALNRNHHQDDGTAESFYYASWLLSFGAAIGLAMIVLAFGQPLHVAGVFAVSACCLWLSRLGRSYAHDQQQPVRVLVSDSTYTGIILIGGAGLIISQNIILAHVAYLQVMAAALAYMALGLDNVKLQVRSVFFGTWRPFIQGFRVHGRHAMLGVLTSEGTSNAHSYIVTLWFGPAAFAPLAAAALFFRPVPLVIQSLTQFERARLARLLRAHENGAAWRAIKFFYVAGMGVWALSVGLAYVLQTYFADMIFHTEHNAAALGLATALFAGIAFCNCLLSPASALLQANADFKPLATTTVISSLVTLPIVLLTVITFGPVWSLLGVLAGNVVAAYLIIRLARKRIPRT